MSTADVTELMRVEDELDRRFDNAMEAATSPSEPCVCSHDVEDHWPREGCLRRGCLCWWWA